MTEIRLKRLPDSVKGIYGPEKNTLPRRVRVIAASVYDRFMEMQEASQHLFQYSGIYRSFEGSYKARLKKGKYVARPGDSGHNFGVSFDLWVEPALKGLASMSPVIDMDALDIQSDLAKGIRQQFRAGVWDIWALRAFFAQFGISYISKEDWHFNIIGHLLSAKPWIDTMYPRPRSMSDDEIARALHAWEINYATREDGVKEFQRMMQIDVDGVVGPETLRYLYLTSLPTRLE